MRPVAIDTDIGSDVDDALALAVFAGCPGLQLVGVTTVYGDTALRARIARRYLGLSVLGTSDVPVHAGTAEPLSGRTVWWTGQEGSLLDDLDAERVDGTDAVGFLRETAARHRGELELVCIGPLTNIALALRADPEFAGAIKHLWIMGGLFDGGPGIDGTGIEHNFRSDDIAAAEVFASPIPCTVVSADVTEQVELLQIDVDRIADAGAIGPVLAREIHQWWDYWATDRNVPHDPLVALAMVTEGLFGYSESGRVTVEVGAEAGRSRFAVGEGPARLVTEIDPERVVRELIARIHQGAAPR